MLSNKEDGIQLVSEKNGVQLVSEASHLHAGWGTFFEAILSQGLLHQRLIPMEVVVTHGTSLLCLSFMY
ncbi:hypothetical protein COLO4_25948 [Corchorus olitorius]|uniref:Uncharacterized protein n=1 Tax=Corchorus olitorius TaxID=93759 RepID=A0A1R3HZB9_9ROSI|nr:hypothetical protein COLO4_25948 [Corchorus olitorius]